MAGSVFLLGFHPSTSERLPPAPIPSVGDHRRSHRSPVLSLNMSPLMSKHPAVSHSQGCHECRFPGTLLGVKAKRQRTKRPWQRRRNSTWWAGRRMLEACAQLTKDENVICKVEGKGTQDLWVTPGSPLGKYAYPCGTQREPWENMTHV